MACHQPVVPVDGMDVAELVNRREGEKKTTALSGGRVTVTHVQTYARIIQIFTVENLDVRAICSCAGTRDVTVSAKKQWAEFKFTSPVFLVNAACLRQRDKTVANKTPPHQKGLIKSSIYLSVALDK